MSEVIKVTITNSGVYDGVTPINVTRSSLGPPNSYAATIDGGGVVGASILDLFAAKTAKLVSIAGDTRGYPGAVVRITSATDPDSIREEIVLQPGYQRLFMACNEVLRIAWTGDGSRSRTIHLVVQDLAERECTPYMRVEHRPDGIMRRFSLRHTGAVTPGSNKFTPDWSFSQGVFQAELTSAAGYLVLEDLFPLLKTDGKGCYVWVKFGGVTPSDVGRVHWLAGDFFTFSAAQPNEKWSNPMWLGTTDRLALRASPVAGSGIVRIDIETSPLMLRRLSGAH